MTQAHSTAAASPATPATAAGGLAMLVAMPALNEERTVADVIRRIPRDLPGVRSVTVLVIDDGSTDATVRLSREAGAVVVSHPSRRGLGAAFQTILRWAEERTFDLIVTLDSDGQFDPATIAQLIAPAVAGEADFVSASRFMDPALVPEMTWIKKWGNRRMSRLISRLAGQDFHDVSCGMRCYTREAAMHLNLLGVFNYAQEVFLNLAFKQLRLKEVPIRVRGQREFGKSRVANDLFRYALNTSRIIFRCYRDYRPMRFFGGLAMALLVPASGLGLFFFIHYLIYHRFTPHLWAGFMAGGLGLLAVLALQAGLIGDMLNRHRIYLEELLYERRRQRSRSGDDRPSA